MLQELLRARADHIHGRWLETVLAAYPAETRTLWLREKDPFANPVGTGLRDGLRATLDAVLSDDEDEARRLEPLRDGLREMIRMRAIQSMIPSQAVGFVLRLKDVLRQDLPSAVREGLAAGAGDPAGVREGSASRADEPAARLAEDLDAGRLGCELAELEERIDRAALLAFDLYVEFRDRLAEIRIAELKKNIPWIVDRMAAAGAGPVGAVASAAPGLAQERE